MRRVRPACRFVAGGGLLLCLPALSDAGGRPAIIDAARQREVAAVRVLLKHHVDVNVMQPDGATALLWAAHWDDVALADILIRAGARVDAVNDYGVSPLWEA